MSEMEKITQLADELKGGLTALQKAQEKQAKDTDGLVKAQVDRVAEDIGAKLQEMQEKQASLQAVIERVGTGGEKADNAEAREKREAVISFLRAGADATKLSVDQVKALSTDNLANGGYLVHAQMLGIINGRVFETSPMRKQANVIKTSNKSVEIILDDDEAGAGWSGENDSPALRST